MKPTILDRLNQFIKEDILISVIDKDFAQKIVTELVRLNTDCIVYKEALSHRDERIDELQATINLQNSTSGIPYFWPLTMWLWVDKDDRLRHSEKEVNEDCIEYAYADYFRNDITRLNRQLAEKDEQIADLNKKNSNLHNSLANEINQNIHKDTEIASLNTALETVADKVLFSTHTNRDIGEYAQNELRAISTWAKSLSTRQDEAI